MANNFNPYMNNIYGNNPFGNPILQEMQSMRDRLDKTMQQYQQTQNQLMNANQQQPTNLTQNFQLTPQGNINDFDGKYANNIEEVKNTLVYRNSLFINKDMSTLWSKDASGKIKTYTLVEVIERDEKDKEIDDLKKQIDDMKYMLANQNSYIEETPKVEEKIEKKTKK